LWPLIIIFWGVETFFGKSRIVSTIFSVIFLLLLAYILSQLVLPPNNPVKQWTRNYLPSLSDRSKGLFKNFETKTKKIVISEADFPEVAKRNVELDMGSSRLDVSDDDSSNYFSLDARYVEGIGEPVVESNQKNEVLDVHFYTNTNQRFTFGQDFKRSYDVSLGKTDTPTDIAIDLGSGVLNLDFEKIVLKKFDLDIGSGSTELDFDLESIPQESFTIDAGSGSTRIIIPEGVAFRIEYELGSGIIKTDSSSLSGDGVFTSENYGVSPILLNMNVNLGSGVVSIKSK
jgi:hypothetical protein